ncbi:hypothetical protein BD779DRAFT_619194 [Infundibulicybe gibba]|nr:hypothetical protein BD779DRAFT_619194 [Infundibulicybe gibba]
MLDLPAEILNLIFTEFNKRMLKDLRLTCKGFNNIIMPILFSHIIIDFHRPFSHTADQIEQLAGSRERGYVYKFARTLEIRGRRGRMKEAYTKEAGALVSAGLSVAVGILVGLQAVRWIIGRADPTVCVEAIVDGLCMLPLGSDLGVRVEHQANVMYAQLVRLGESLTSFSIIVRTQNNFLNAKQPRDMKLLAALVASSPRLERLEFYQAPDEGLADLDLDVIFGEAPPRHACIISLTVDGFRLRLGRALYRLRGLESLTLHATRQLGSMIENDSWLIPVWNALGAARVFPPALNVRDDSNALIDFLSQHPRLEALALHRMRQPQRLQGYYNRGHDTFEAAFFADVLPHHSNTLKKLQIDFHWATVPTECVIAECHSLETLTLCLAWAHGPAFTEAFEKLLVLLRAIPRMQRVTLAIAPTGLFRSDATQLEEEVNKSVWNTVTTSVLGNNVQCVPAEIVARGRLFRLRIMDGARRYIDARVGE